MRLLIQRVLGASVTVEQEVVSQIENGLLIFVGFGSGDNPIIFEKIANKVLQLRVFADEFGKMNQNIQEIAGSLLVISQFTLYGNTQKGNRPSFTEAAPPSVAQSLYTEWLKILQQKYPRVHAGIFAASMKVSLINDGPVTIWIDSEQWK